MHLPMNPLSAAEQTELIQRAQAAALNAYCAYSKFRVGAAVLGKRIYTGANVENASYGLALCAERSALAAAIAAGDRDFRALAVACIDASPEAGLLEKMPCGACRQWILELAPHAAILIAGADRIYTIQDLLPIPFSLS